MPSDRMVVDVWSDVVCPWCRIGTVELDRAIAQFDGEVEVRLHSFELDPSAPPLREESLAEQLGAKYGAGPEQVDAMFDGVRQRGAALGIDFRFDIARSGNTFDAHRLLHLAATHDRQGALSERLFRAYFSEGEAVGDPAVLERLATDAGLDAGEVRQVLDSDQFAAEVRADEEQARQLQVSGVPFFVIDGRYGVPGAQPAEVLLSALQQAATTSG